MLRDPIAQRTETLRVVFSTPGWGISGVNTFTHNLIRALLRREIDAELLLIRPQPAAVGELPLPDDIPVSVLEWSRGGTWWRARWEALAQYLRDRAPCVYVPNYDFENSCIVPALPDSVGVVGIMHSDDPLHYEHAIRLGRYWNAVISVSEMLHRSVLAEIGDLRSRAFHIAYGVPHPLSLPESNVRGQETLRILYSGRFYEPQKRISDLPRIGMLLRDRGVPYQIDLIGSGQDEATLRQDFESLVSSGHARFLGSMPNDALLHHYAEHDCLILTSNFEGLPLALLEAMGHGCIPVVTDVRSGIPDVVRDGVHGFRLPVGDVDGFADRLATLQGDPELRTAMRHASFEVIAQGGYSIDAVADRYIELFQGILREALAGAWHRPRTHRTVESGATTGDIIPPPSLQICPDEHFSMKWRYERALERINQLEADLRRHGGPAAHGRWRTQFLGRLLRNSVRLVRRAGY